MLSQQIPLYQTNTQFNNWTQIPYSPYVSQPQLRSNKENLYQSSTTSNKYKYKTELCKNWEEHGCCPYGSKCRFAHGTTELNFKDKLNDKYKSKPCQSFFTTMYCHYGSRCLFKHDERSVGDINKCYYTTLNICPDIWELIPKRRLPIFENISNEVDINEIHTNGLINN